MSDTGWLRDLPAQRAATSGGALPMDQHPRGQNDGPVLHAGPPCPESPTNSRPGVIGSTATAAKRARLILPIMVAGLLAALLCLWLTHARPSTPKHTVSSVSNEIRRLALHRSTTPGLEDGGAIGSWWIFARSVDETGNTFHDFRMRAGGDPAGRSGLHLAARTATLIIDPDENSISFDLRDVVILSMPSGQGNTEDGGLVRLDSFMLGPAPYRRNIVADPASRFEPPRGSRLAGVGD